MESTQESKKDVLVDQQKAPVDNKGVETSNSQAPENDPEALIKAMQEKIDKLSRDRDGYRDGMLALKGKKGLESLDLTDEVQAQAYIEKMVEEKLAATRKDEAEGNYKETVLQQARRLKELERALASKSASTSIAGGVSSGSAFSAGSEKETSYFSPEQKEDLKKRWQAQRIPEKKWEDMLKRAEENSRTS